MSLRGQSKIIALDWLKIKKLTNLGAQRKSEQLVNMSIITEAENFVGSLLTEKLSKDLTYHNLPHSLAVRNACKEYRAKKSGISEEEIEVLELGCPVS